MVIRAPTEPRLLLRIEDLDGPRIKAGAAEQAIDDLRWLGLDWDEPPSYQSRRTAQYDHAIGKLIDCGLAYPCVCSRREATLAASAPHVEDAVSVYPGTCRERFRSLDEARAHTGREPAIRFRVPREIVSFDDRFAGRRQFQVDRELGDFVIRKADGTAAYQLAVVIDDSDAGVSEVVRGDDLIDSTPRQILLYRAVGLDAQVPNYAHLPLVVGPDGRRLAKRHGDTRLAHYRERGVTGGRLVAMLARWLGVENCGDEALPADLLSTFELGRVPTDPIVFEQRDERWLWNKTTDAS